MPRLDHQTSPQVTGAGHARWIAIGVVVAAIAIGVVLLVLYGGGGGSTGY